MATELLDGKVLVIGGFRTDTGELDSTEVYDPGKKNWTPKANLHTARSSSTATLLGSGKVLVTGGYSPTGPINTAELYDPKTDQWTPTGSMEAARYNHTATLLISGEVLVTGGQDRDGFEFKTSELYDPKTGQWTPTGSMKVARHFHKATLLPSHKVLVTGGRNVSTGYLKSAEVYDPRTGQWIPTQDMETARDKHTATLLSTGKVLVTGGSNSDNPANYLGSTEVYDPDTEQWSSKEAMLTPRFSHTATNLSSGKILVVGGGNDSEASATEVYISVPPAAPQVTTPSQDQYFDTSKPDIAGTAEPCSAVKVSLDGLVWEWVSADAHGAWSYPLDESLQPGLHTLSVIATDEGGNESGPSVVAFIIRRSHYGWDCATTSALPASGVWLVVILEGVEQG
jgi:hypothetical protein